MGLQIEANRFREVGHDFQKHFYQFMKNLKYCFFPSINNLNANDMANQNLANTNEIKSVCFSFVVT